MMAKFKVGDKVKVVQIFCGADDVTLGQIGAVTNLDDDDDHRVAFSDGSYWHYQPNELELVTTSSAPETITLRDQFAMAALTSGLIDFRGAGIEVARIPGMIAKRAYDIAGAMLAERERAK